MKFTLKMTEVVPSDMTYDDFAPYSVEYVFYADNLEEVLMHMTMFLKGGGYVTLDGKELTYKDYK